jgi:uncharacterized protein with GYD domain
MTIYITQGCFTAKAVEGALNKPEDRTQAVAALMEASGGKLLNYYVTFGEYDFLIIAEGESEKDVLAGLLTAASTGTVTDLCTVPAITAADAKAVYEKAQSMRAGFKPTGA